jgi:hypothetical protein
MGAARSLPEAQKVGKKLAWDMPFVMEKHMTLIT